MHGGFRVPSRKRLSAGYIDRAGAMAARERRSRSLFFGVCPPREGECRRFKGRVRSPAQLIRPNSEVRPVPAVRPPPHPDVLESPLIARRNIRLGNARRRVLASRRGFRFLVDGVKLDELGRVGPTDAPVAARKSLTRRHCTWTVYDVWAIIGRRKGRARSQRHDL